MHIDIVYHLLIRVPDKLHCNLLWHFRFGEHTHIFVPELMRTYLRDPISLTVGIFFSAASSATFSDDLSRISMFSPKRRPVPRVPRRGDRLIRHPDYICTCLLYTSDAADD